MSWTSVSHFPSPQVLKRDSKLNDLDHRSRPTYWFVYFSFILPAMECLEQTTYKQRVQSFNNLPESSERNIGGSKLPMIPSRLKNTLFRNLKMKIILAGAGVIVIIILVSVELIRSTMCQTFFYFVPTMFTCSLPHIGALNLMKDAAQTSRPSSSTTLFLTTMEAEETAATTRFLISLFPLFV